MQKNQLTCNYWLMLPRDHFVSRFLYFTTADVQCCVAAVKSCPVLHFSVLKLFWSFGIIDASTIKCWELSNAHAGARGRGGRCLYSFSLMYRLNQTECNLVVINASEGSLCFQIFITEKLKATHIQHLLLEMCNSIYEKFVQALSTFKIKM
jgi:hypothetical protein